MEKPQRNRKLFCTSVTGDSFHKMLYVAYNKHLLRKKNCKRAVTILTKVSKSEIYLSTYTTVRAAGRENKPTPPDQSESSILINSAAV